MQLKMTIRQGQKFLCKKEVLNVFSWPLFKKGETYVVLHVDNEQVTTQICLNHILYANEYQSFDIEFIRENFNQL